jgi:very-short-patch-repair endonuclease
VITRTQLLELGVTDGAIAHRLRVRRLRRLHRGVFVIAGREVGCLERWMAAVLACGADALLSHQSAAELWGIRAHQVGDIAVSVGERTRRRPRDVRVHRRRGLTSLDRDVHRGIPVTSPARTLVDLAATVRTPQLESAVNQADKLDLISPEELRGLLEAMGRQRGVERLRALLDRQMFRLTDSELERRFLRLVRDADLPLPETRVWLNGFRVDFFWPNLGLVVETDGLRYHRTPGQQDRDRRRDQAHAAAGLTTIRFTHGQVRYGPDRVREVLVRVAARLSRRRAAA